MPDSPQLTLVLANLKRAAPGITAQPDSRGEWFLLKSPASSDGGLFERLKFVWPQVVLPHDQDSFAVILCQEGPDRGLWLHYLATPTLRTEYLPGFHSIESWA
jgi:hypothetical protein